MNVDNTVPAARTADRVVGTILAANSRFLLVSEVQMPGATVDQARSVLNSADRQVAVIGPSALGAAETDGAVVALYVPPAQAADLARRAVAAGAAAVWLGPGLVSDEAKAVTDAAGVPYVEDRDLKLEFEVNVLGAPRRDFVPM